MNPELMDRLETDFLVLFSEEWGFRTWFWFPPMYSQELEAWWRSQESVAMPLRTDVPAPGGKKLPGDLYQAIENDEYDLFDYLLKSKQHYYVHINFDDDSWLVTPEGVEIHHAGFTGE